MKKLLVVLLAAATLFTFAACNGGSSSKSSSGSSAANESTEVTGVAATTPNDAGQYTKAEVTLKDGVIESVSIDVWYPDKANWKKALGSDYGMTGIAPKGEWDVQAKAFEDWCVGKTVDDVLNVATTKNDEGNDVPADTDLAAGCTISISEFQEAIKLAADQATDTATKHGTAQTAVADDGSYTRADVTLDADGKIVSTYINTWYPNGSAWKKELGSNYGMTGIAPKGEWDVQAKAFEDWTVGKTVDEVMNVATTKNEEGNEIPADTDLAAGCTIAISQFQEAVKLAAEAAK